MPFEFDLSDWNAATARIAESVAQGPRDPDIGGGMQSALGFQDDNVQKEYYFASAGDGRWPALAYSTIRKRMGESHSRDIHQLLFGNNMGDYLPILIITGRKYNSLAQGQPDHYMNITQDSMQSGTSVFDAHYHQGGAQRGRWSLPARPIIIPPDDATERKMQQAVSAGIGLAIEKAIGDAGRSI